MFHVPAGKYQNSWMTTQSPGQHLGTLYSQTNAIPFDR